jgi:hypothetical protein
MATPQPMIRLEEYTGVLQNKLVAVWDVGGGTVSPWLPTEFMLGQYITRILVAGRAAGQSTAMAADPSWTQVWRSPGGKEWSCLLGILPHMPGPVLVVVGPDMPLTPKLVASLREVCRGTSAPTVVVLRQAGGAGWAGDAADQVFFPVLPPTAGPLMPVVQEWAGRAAPRGLDLKVLLPQLAAQGYALTVADGVWQWYKPADSVPMATLTVAQVARQLQILGAVLEQAGI